MFLLKQRKSKQNDLRLVWQVSSLCLQFDHCSLLFRCDQASSCQFQWVLLNHTFRNLLRREPTLSKKCQAPQQLDFALNPTSRWGRDYQLDVIRVVLSDNEQWYTYVQDCIWSYFLTWSRRRPDTCICNCQRYSVRTWYSCCWNTDWSLQASPTTTVFDRNRFNQYERLSDWLFDSHERSTDWEVVTVGVATRNRKIWIEIKAMLTRQVFVKRSPVKRTSNLDPVIPVQGLSFLLHWCSTRRTINGTLPHVRLPRTLVELTM